MNWFKIRVEKGDKDVRRYTINVRALKKWGRGLRKMVRPMSNIRVLTCRNTVLYGARKLVNKT